MRRTFYMLGLLSVTALASCSFEPDLQDELSTDCVRGTMEQIVSDASTKAFAEYNSDLKKYYIYWNEEDLISVFKTTNLNQKYIFDQFDGAPSGTFSKVPEDESVSGSDPIETGYQYSIYPYDKKYNTCTVYGTMTVMFPAAQSVHDKEWEDGVGACLLMAARSTSSSFSFKHVGSYIAVTLKGEGVSVKSITFAGNNSEIVAGLSTVTFDDNDEPIVEFKNNSYKYNAITMDFTEPVALSSEEQEFWLIVPSITLSEGYTLTVTDENGGIFQKKTSSSLTLKRKGFYHCRATVVTTTPVTGVTLNKSALTMDVDNEINLVATVAPENATDKSVTWSTSDESVATVDQNGLVKAVAPGTATITVTTTDGGKTATCSVKVNNVITYSLTIDPAEDAKVIVGDTKKFTLYMTTITNGVSGEPEEVTSGVSWESDNSGIASINNNGVAKGEAEGTVTITAKYTTPDNKPCTHTAPLTVTKDPNHAGDPIVIGGDQNL